MCIDNSEWTRSGDYAPTRFQAQTDAVNLLAGAKMQANPENAVGVLTMAGRTPRVLVTPTVDLGKVLNCMADIPLEGENNISAAVQIAQLALKHRQNKNQRQRIVIFCGSPVREEQARGGRGGPCGCEGSLGLSVSSRPALPVMPALLRRWLIRPMRSSTARNSAAISSPSAQSPGKASARAPARRQAATTSSAVCRSER